MNKKDVWNGNKIFFKNSLIFSFTILSELTFSIGQIQFGLLTVYLL